MLRLLDRRRVGEPASTIAEREAILALNTDHVRAVKAALAESEAFHAFYLEAVRSYVAWKRTRAAKLRRLQQEEPQWAFLHSAAQNEVLRARRERLEEYYQRSRELDQLLEQALYEEALPRQRQYQLERQRIADLNARKAPNAPRIRIPPHRNVEDFYLVDI